MQNAKRFGVFSIALLCASCTLGEQSPAPQETSSATGPSDQMARAAETSCPDGTVFLTPQSIEIAATPITATNETDWDGALSGARVAGIWHLTSPEPNFGGLSGLAVTPAGDLLSVTDQGAFVEIGLEDGAPSGAGSIGYMRGANGQPLSGKDTSDSEGLHLNGDLALVSFERAHRVSAFNIGGCGMAAREVAIANPQTDRAPNQGMEALTLRGDEIIAGWEGAARGTGLLSKFDTSSGIDIGETKMPTPRGLNLTGLDHLDGQTFAVFRAFSPFTGNKIEVHEYSRLTDGGQMRVRLKKPLPVDNYEGIAATRLEDGSVRLYIIADNNFSERQRTLLMAIDLEKAAP